MGRVRRARWGPGFVERAAAYARWRLSFLEREGCLEIRGDKIALNPDCPPWRVEEPRDVKITVVLPDGTRLEPGFARRVTSLRAAQHRSDAGDEARRHEGGVQGERHG